MLSVPVAADDARPADGAPGGAPARRRSWSSVLVPGLSVALAGTGFLPWIASGKATYSSYALASVTRRSGMLDGAAGLVPTLWLLVPLLAATVLAAAVLGAHRIAATVASVLAVVALVACSATIAGVGGVGGAGLDLLVGPFVALLVASVLVLCLGGTLIAARVARAATTRSRAGHALVPPPAPQGSRR